MDRLLSAAATRLYEDLLQGVAADPDGETVEELLRRGLAVRTDAGLEPVAPAAVLPRSLGRELDRLAEDQQSLSAAFAEAGRLQSRFAAAQLGADASAHVTVLTGAAVRTTVAAMITGARREILHLNAGIYRVAPTIEGIVDPDPEALRGGLEVRCVYAHRYLELGDTEAILRHTQRLGEHIRVSDQVPLTLYLTDGRLALVPLPLAPTPTAVLFTDTALVGSLAAVFTACWDRATQWESERTSEELTPAQRRVLELLAAGFSDDRVAATLGVTTRTVRRHVASLMDRLGASTRFAAAVAAQRRGWV